MKELDCMGCRLDAEGEGEDETERKDESRVVRDAVTVRRYVVSRDRLLPRRGRRGRLATRAV
jgi:hypothetical protein